jgi:nitroreductase
LETREAIRTRRSVRTFTPDPVPQATVRALLEAAMQAPSAGNQQPWQFVVIDDRPLLDAIPAFAPYAPMCRTAPLAILVCGDLREVRHPGFWVQDCSAATQNLLLAAHDLGLGARWTGVHPRETLAAGFRRLLGLPDEVLPLALVVLGHPAERIEPVARFQADRIHTNAW